MNEFHSRFSEGKAPNKRKGMSGDVRWIHMFNQEGLFSHLLEKEGEKDKLFGWSGSVTLQFKSHP